MSISIYKPNSKNTGCAFSFRYGVQRDGEPCLFLNAIQQHSWNNDSKTGSFSANSSDPSKNLKIKFNEFECGSILSAFKRRYEYNTFHTYEENKTTIKISPWDKEIKISSLNHSTKKIEEKKQKIPAFGISITRNGTDNFKISLEPGEVEVVSEFMRSILSKITEFRISKQIENLKNS
tara:strand:- start:367 stop:900 length:534 start_codon:yes stop_codon:yes gene_type:complete